MSLSSTPLPRDVSFIPVGLPESEEVVVTSSVVEDDVGDEWEVL